jgi:chromosome segregation ATPase
MWLRFKLWWVSRGLVLADRTVATAESRMEDVNANLACRRRSLAQQKVELTRMRSDIQKMFNHADNRLRLLYDSLAEDLKDAEKSQSRYGEAIEKLRSERDVLRDVTLPTLVAEHTRIRECLNADTAHEVRKRVVASPGNE